MPGRYTPYEGCRIARKDTTALPFCQTTLMAEKPRNQAYPKVLKTLGDHIRKRRLDLGLFQKDMGRLVRVDTTTVTNWERGRTEPTLRLMPPVLRFLGYIPNAQEGTVGERLRTHMRFKGISQKGLAILLGIDPTTLARWESGKSTPSGKYRDQINRILDSESTLG